MTPTSPRLLLLVAALSAAAGWGLARAFDEVAGRYLPVSWSGAIGLGMLAAALLCWALLVRPRLRHKEGSRPLDPLVAARTAALAMAASRTGAVLGGLYVGIGLAFLPIAGQDPGRERLLAAGAAVLAAVAVVLVALWLERMCRLPDPPPEGMVGRDDSVAHG
jgi:hypothetical protein